MTIFKSSDILSLALKAGCFNEFISDGLVKGKDLKITLKSLLLYGSVTFFSVVLTPSKKR